MMKKEKWSYSASVYAVLLFLMVSLSLLPCMQTQAASKKTPSIDKVQELDYFSALPSDLNTVVVLVQDVTSKDKIYSVKSSNTKIASAKAASFKDEYGKRYYGIECRLKKPGRVNITFKVKRGTKVYSLKTKLIITKYESPISSLKIGKTSFASKLKKTSHYFASSYHYGKISVSPKSGWKVRSLVLCNLKTGRYSILKNKVSEMKLKKNYQLAIELVKKSDGSTRWLYVTRQ